MANDAHKEDADEVHVVMRLSQDNRKNFGAQLLAALSFIDGDSYFVVHVLDEEGLMGNQSMMSLLQEVGDCVRIHGSVHALMNSAVGDEGIFEQVAQQTLMLLSVKGSC